MNISPKVQASTDRQLLDRLYRNTPSSITSTLFVSGILLAVLWPEIDHSRLILWVIFLAMTSTLKALVYLSFAKQHINNLNTDVWKRRYLSRDIFSSLAWGSAGILLYSSSSMPHQTLLILALGGVAAGGIHLRSSDLRALIFFLFLTLMPLCIRLLLEGNSMHAAMGAMLFLYICLFLKIGLQNHNTIKNALTLRYENEQLIDHLTRNRDQAERINQELKAEILGHKATAKELIEARDNAQLAARSKSEFLATMSHEIRTPMNGVLGMAELLVNSGLTGKQLRFTETILQSGQALLAIINDILDFSRIEAGKMELQPDLFDLRKLVEDCGDQFAARAEHKGLELICDYPIEAQHTFIGDKDKINQILNNLVANAIKFTKRGDVKIEVEIKHRDALSSTVRLLVEDSGIGISPEVHDRIFDSFSQADGTTTRNYGGTGLGLAICKKLCELMQGRIGVESIPDKGSVFWVELDLKHADKLLNHSPIESARDLKAARILVLDSNQNNREMLEREITGWHAQCRCVATPKQALQQLISASATNKPYDLAIIDKKMPDMDGIQLAHRIKKANDISDISLIMLSSVASLADTGGWMMAGIDGYLSKPVRQDELYSTLTRVLGIEQQLAGNSDSDQPSSDEAAFNGHILVAEDNSVNSELAAHLLANLGCTYVIAESGQDALDALFNSPLDALQRPYDLILMDCQMPVLDGYQATRQIRQHEFQQGLGAHIPVIALTANSMPGDRERCLQAGMDDYLSKPFKLEQLSGMLQKWLPLIRETSRSEMAMLSPQHDEPAASSQSVNSAHIDQASLLKIKSLQRAGAPNILHKLINLYLDNSPTMIEQIETAISSGDFSLLRSAAHSLKSCSLSLGAVQLGEQCRELESMSQTNSLDGLIARLQVIQFEYEQVCRALEAQLGSEAA